MSTPTISTEPISSPTTSIQYATPPGYPLLQPLDPMLDTLPKNFLAQAQHRAARVAMRKKRYGIWLEYTWAECLEHIKYFCLGLVSLGLQHGEKVSIIGDNDPEYYWAELAVQSAGGVSIGVFTDANPQELQYLVTDSDSVFVIAHDQEQCDKMLEMRQKVPLVRHVIYWEERGLWNYDDSWLLSLEQVEAKGRDYEKAHPHAYEELVAAGTSADIAILSYTSGTTSLPKGAMIAHFNLLYGCRQVSSLVPALETDNYVSFSPLAWITEQSLGLANFVANGFIVNFPERPETVQNDIREIAPSSLLFPSRLWESLLSQMQVRLNDSSWINRKLYELFMPIGYKVVDFEDKGQPVPMIWKLLYQVGQLAVFQPLRDKMGMINMREAFTSGASLSPDALRWFRAVGVTLKNLYGSTECQAHTLHFAGEARFETVGKPPPGVEVKIADNNEIWVRSRAVFKGYYKAAEASVKALDSEGWFHTGDAGYIREDGHLIYLDRVKDLIALANGERFSPQYIETRLRFSPYIQDAMSIGSETLPFVSSIIVIQFENVARWAEKNRISFTTYVDLSQKMETYDLVRRDIERVNETLPTNAQIKRFVILHKAFDADDSELTRTRKLRRGVLADRYQEMIEAIYSGRDEVNVRAEVKYRDGRLGSVETAIRIARV